MDSSRGPRCLHFIPAPSLQRFAAKIPDIAADGFVFDINSAVCGMRDSATRENLRRFLRSRRPKRDVVVRISPPREQVFDADLDFALGLCPDMLFVSKIESEDEMRCIAAKLAQAEPRCGKKIALFISIESLRGHNRRDSILRAVDCLSLYVVGYEDLSSYMGIVRPSLKESGPLRAALQSSIDSARAANVPIIDSVSFMYRPEKLAEFRDEVIAGKELGLCGKLSVHPNQVPIINEIYDRPAGRLSGASRDEAARHAGQSAA